MATKCANLETTAPIFSKAVPTKDWKNHGPSPPLQNHDYILKTITDMILKTTNDDIVISNLQLLHFNLI